MRLTKDGFELKFTKPVDPKLAADPQSYLMTTFTHEYKPGYGSPEVDQAPVKIKLAKVSDDGATVRLVLDGLRVGYIHELTCAGIRSTDEEPLLHDMAWYTLNQLRGE